MIFGLGWILAEPAVNKVTIIHRALIALAPRSLSAHGSNDCSDHLLIQEAKLTNLDFSIKLDFCVIEGNCLVMTCIWFSGNKLNFV